MALSETALGADMWRLMMMGAIVIALGLQSGCATKMYGRQGSLTGFEKEVMTCREIDIEIAKASGFLDHVNKESEFSGRDVLAILGDFGIGNLMERSAAVESANSRIEQLQISRNRRGCAYAPTEPTKPFNPALMITPPR